MKQEESRIKTIRLILGDKKEKVPKRESNGKEGKKRISMIMKMMEIRYANNRL